MTTKGARDHWPPERIKAERDAAGMSQDDLAAVLGVSGGAVSQWETGATKPLGRNKAKLARLFLDGEREVSIEDRINSLAAEVRELRAMVRVLQIAVGELDADQSS